MSYERKLSFEMIDVEAREPDVGEPEIERVINLSFLVFVFFVTMALFVVVR